MPCVNVVANECPCWTEAQLDLVGLHVDENGASTDDCAEFGANQVSLSGIDVDTGLEEFAVADVGDPEFCFSRLIENDSNGVPQNVGVFLQIEAEEGVTCALSVVAEATSP